MISDWSKKSCRANTQEFQEEEKVNLVSTGVFVDHIARLSTNLPQMLDKGLMTEFELPERVLDLKWEFPYGTDQQIQVQENEIFIFDEEI